MFLCLVFCLSILLPAFGLTLPNVSNINFLKLFSSLIESLVLCLHFIEYIRVQYSENNLHDSLLHLFSGFGF